jgi:hypothetical protein
LNVDQAARIVFTFTRIYIQAVDSERGVRPLF